MYKITMKVKIPDDAYYFGVDRINKLEEISEYIEDLFYDVDTIKLKTIHIKEVGDGQ